MIAKCDNSNSYTEWKNNVIAIDKYLSSMILQCFLFIDNKDMWIYWKDRVSLPEFNKNEEMDIMSFGYCAKFN